MRYLALRLARLPLAAWMSRPAATTEAGHQRRSAWPWVVLVVSLALILLAAFVFWRVETWPSRTAGDIAGVFQRTLQFQPEVKVEQDVILEQVTRTAELATAERVVVVEQGYENSWLLSTKRLRARGTFTAKAGFDLTKGVEAQVDRDNRRLEVLFPPPELLSVGQDRVEILQWDNGLWNKLQGSDAERAVNELTAVAEQQAGEEGLLEEAKASVQAELTSRLLEETGLLAVVRFRE
jgi:hypothetical protein